MIDFMYPCAHHRVNESAREGIGRADFEVSHVGFLVESGRGQSESVDDVVNLRFTLLKFLRGFLGGSMRDKG